jgi:hypothetical protein
MHCAVGVLSVELAGASPSTERQFMSKVPAQLPSHVAVSAMLYMLYSSEVVPCGAYLADINFAQVIPSTQ